VHSQVHSQLHRSHSTLNPRLLFVPHPKGKVSRLQHHHNKHIKQTTRDYHCLQTRDYHCLHSQHNTLIPKDIHRPPLICGHT
jgi:hypothetical protein